MHGFDATAVLHEVLVSGPLEAFPGLLAQGADPLVCRYPAKLYNFVANVEVEMDCACLAAHAIAHPDRFGALLPESLSEIPLAAANPVSGPGSESARPFTLLDLAITMSAAESADVLLERLQPTDRVQVQLQTIAQRLLAREPCVNRRDPDLPFLLRVLRALPQLDESLPLTMALDHEPLVMGTLWSAKPWAARSPLPLAIMTSGEVQPLAEVVLPRLLSLPGVAACRYPNADDGTLLHAAASAGLSRVVRAGIAAGLDPQVSDAHGRKPWEVSSDPTCTALLLSAAARRAVIDTLEQPHAVAP